MRFAYPTYHINIGIDIGLEPVERISASAFAKSMGQKKGEQKEAEQCAAAVDVQPSVNRPQNKLTLFCQVAQE